MRAASRLDGPALGIARTFVGFDDAPRVLTCFAACATRRRDAEAPACEAAARAARLDGSVAPPKPGLALGAVTWAVHNPRPAAACGAVLVLALALLAIQTRRRPRSRIA
jgi:hypothetical protein